MKKEVFVVATFVLAVGLAIAVYNIGLLNKIGRASCRERV